MVANLKIEEWHAVHQRLRGIAKRRAELDAEEARCLRDAERIQLWRRFGYVHMGEYLERELGYGPHTGAERLRVARALGELPLLEAALGDGVLHYSAVRELSRIATRDSEAEWLEAARGKSGRQIEAAVAGRKRGDRPADLTSPELVNRVVRLELSPDVFALLRQAQSALADEHGGRLDDNAFVQALCRRALEGAVAGEHARPAHQISITLCESCKRGWQNGAGREIEVGPEVIERAQCDAEHLGPLEAPTPARITATVTPRIRRQVLARDQHRCTAPGCRSARNLDLHHIEFQSDGGDHQLWNITTLCTGHHQRLHEGALMIRGRAPDALEFTWRSPVAPEIEEALSHAGPEGLLRAPDAALPMEHAQSHTGPAVTRIVQDVEAFTEQAESHAGPEVPLRVSESHSGSKMTLDVPDVVTSEEHAQSHTGPSMAQRAQGAVPVEQVQSHKGSEVRPHATGAAPVERLQSHKGSKIGPHATVTASTVEQLNHDAIAQDVRDALTTAGYRAHEARRAVEQARSRVGPEATLEQLLREALRCCSAERRC